MDFIDSYESHSSAGVLEERMAPLVITWRNAINHYRYKRIAQLSLIHDYITVGPLAMIIIEYAI